MTLSWDPDDERVVIEVFPFTEAAVVAPGRRSTRTSRSPSPTRCFLVRLTAGARPGVREARRAGPRRRAADLPVLRQPDRPRRAPLRARQRLPPPGPVTVDRTDADLARRRARRSTAGSCRRRTPPSSARSTASGSSTSRSRGSARCGTSPTAPSPAARWRRTLVSEALGWDVVPHDLAARRPARPGHGAAAGWSPTRTQDAGRHRADGRGARRAGCTSSTASTATTGAVSLVHEDSERAAPDGGVRRGGQQRRPQGRPRAGDAGRPPVRRRPRRLLPRRAQAAHRALGLGRRAAAPTTRWPRSPRRVRDGGPARWATRSAALLTDREIDALARRCAPAAATAGVLPAPRGSWPGDPVAALLTRGRARLPAHA